MNGKIYATILSVMLVIFAVWNYMGDNTDVVVEPFLNVPLGVKPMAVAQNNAGQQYAVRKGYMYQVPPTFQNQLSPRFSSEGCYGSFIRYNMPDQAHLGVPNNPLDYGNMVGDTGCAPPSDGQGVGNASRENYCGSCNVQSCGKGGVSCGAGDSKAALGMMGANYADVSYHAAKSNLETTPVTDALPVGAMDSLQSDGAVQQPIIYDRLVYGLQKSKLHGLGDFIRGDLPIAQCNVGGGQWFTPSANPQFDLNTGAMAVLGGLDMETPRATYALVNAASAGQKVTMGGGDMQAALNMATQQTGCTTGAGTDVQYTAFP